MNIAMCEKGVESVKEIAMVEEVASTRIKIKYGWVCVGSCGRASSKDIDIHEISQCILNQIRGLQVPLPHSRRRYRLDIQRGEICLLQNQRWSKVADQTGICNGLDEGNFSYPLISHGRSGSTELLRATNFQSFGNCGDPRKPTYTLQRIC